jgi:large subunit ribosomal protein L18
MAKRKEDARLKRKLSIRAKVVGTTDRPRLTVFRSAKHIYAQVVDDAQHQTVASASTLDEALQGGLTGKKKKDKAVEVGTAIARKCKEKGIEKVVFDRNGYIYHGRVSALADAARKGGLKF